MSVGFLLLVLVITLPDPVSADSFTWASDTDFTAGTLDSNLVLRGTGAAAYLELRKSDFPDWMRMAPATIPTRRIAYCLAWVDTDNSFLMFGGYGPSGMLGDTWKYNFTLDQWTQLSPPSGPTPRAYAGCAYDPLNQVVVLFGGIDTSFQYPADTWGFDVNTNTWAQKFPAGATPRNLNSSTPMTYDSQADRILMVGRNGVTLQMETWAYDYATNLWSNRNPGGTTITIRDGHNIAYDVVSDRTILVSGAEGLVLRNDFWEYAWTANTWSKVRDFIQDEDPYGRIGHGLTYRDSYSGVFLFGGYDGGGYPPESWVYIYALGDWYLPPITGTPFGRRFINMANSPVDDATLLFGGEDSGGLKNDTWALAKGYVQNVDGVWTSSATPIDAGCDNVNFDAIYWNNSAQPTGAILRFQIATSATDTGPWTFRGAGGFPGDHYTTSGQAIWSGTDNQRFFRVLAKLKTTNGRVTPTFDDVTLTWTCPPTNPYVKDTNPFSGQTTHPINAPIWVNFSEPMNTTSVTWTISGGITATGSWFNSDRLLKLTPTTPFRDCTPYTAQILTGIDQNDGLPLVAGPVPNPWSFTTVCINPYVVSTDPADGDFNVPLTLPITVEFNEPMNTGTVNQTITPGVGLTPSWDGARDTLTLNHGSDFVACTLYTVEITAGEDDQGLPLVAGPVPNPWTFFSSCNNPYIVTTNPADGATGVAVNANVVVTFSEGMVPASVTWSISGGITLSGNWNTPTDTILTLTHATPFTELQTYTVQILTGTDKNDGFSLVPGPVPNPWSFTVIGINPKIASTSPANGATSVPLDANVVVTFDEPMNTASVTWTISGGITLSGSWNTPTDTILTLTHATPFAQCTLYTAEITAGNDKVGLPLVGGAVPNPWTFRTICPLGSPAGLTLLRLPPSSILLDWNDVPSATGYFVYESQNRFANFPSGWNLMTPTPVSVSQFTVTHLGDGLTHYYVVRATDGVAQGPNSSMGVKIARTFPFTSSQTNIAWFSLPYRSGYARASDIANEIGSTNIDSIGKWDPAKQSSVVYYFSRGRWRGADFTINSGDGLWLGVRQSFTWVIVGTDLSVPLAFTLNPPPKTNVNWVGIPYTGIYNRASAIATELTFTKIVEVGLWDPATQTSVRWFWNGSTWTGTDFTFTPGAGIYVIVASSFAWTPTLITPAVP